jgi:hypothetical protein
MTLVSQAEYARRCGVSSAAITQWKKAQRIVLQGNKIDVEASDALLARYRRGGLPASNTAPENVKLGRPRVKQKAQLNDSNLTLNELSAQLNKLDYTHDFDWSGLAMDERARLVAQCIGWTAVTSDVRDDGHHGGYQLRCAKTGEVMVGFGFELSACEVLFVCRDEITPDDDDPLSFTHQRPVSLDLLPLLARPFHECDQKQPRSEI